MTTMISFWVFRVRSGKTVGGKAFPHHTAWARHPSICERALEGVCVARLRSLHVLLREVERHSKPELADVTLARRKNNKGDGSSPRAKARDGGGGCFKRSKAGGASSPTSPRHETTVLEPSFDSEGTQRVNSFSEEERRARFEEAFFE
eukprot:COSAG02_NODE_37254_length_444_cov_0.855072_1_plen_147_part_11